MWAKDGKNLQKQFVDQSLVILFPPALGWLLHRSLTNFIRIFENR